MKLRGKTEMYKNKVALAIVCVKSRHSATQDRLIVFIRQVAQAASTMRAVLLPLSPRLLAIGRIGGGSWYF